MSSPLDVDADPASRAGPDGLAFEDARPWFEARDLHAGAGVGPARTSGPVALAWSAGRPLELAVRAPIDRGLAVGVVAELSPRRAALDAFLDADLAWNASATAELDLDRRGTWRLSTGAGARSVPTGAFEAIGTDAGEAEGEAEGVVWLRLGARF